MRGLPDLLGFTRQDRKGQKTLVAGALKREKNVEEAKQGFEDKQGGAVGGLGGVHISCSITWLERIIWLDQRKNLNNFYKTSGLKTTSSPMMRDGFKISLVNMAMGQDDEPAI
ncbi:hypothetical protein L6452_32620 [Arctium lappa]|uniref:Uncharacterized protein n=1 Tax=Arctium lappa TaxID=4217 RepID=A0ACB8Z469_ARCLA|nr:hypothetical protein L6452_32620 [Arctium lappa]